MTGDAECRPPAGDLLVVGLVSLQAYAAAAASAAAICCLCGVARAEPSTSDGPTCNTPSNTTVKIQHIVRRNMPLT